MVWYIKKLSVGPENPLTGQVAWAATVKESGTGEEKLVQSAYNPAVGLTTAVVKDALCQAAIDPNELGACT